MFNLEKIIILLVCFLFLGMGYYYGQNKKFKDQKILLNLFIPIFIYIVIVAKIAPFLGENYTSRYIMLLFPLFALLMMYLFNLFYNSKYFNIISIGVILLIRDL